MKKKVSFGLVFLTGLSSQALASAGYAKDGLEFLLFLVGVLLLAAGLLEGIDYLRKNGKALMHQIKASIKKKMLTQ